jgi:hypothetical protein
LRAAGKMSKPTEVILLCEDRLTSMLLRRYLNHSGVNSRNVRLIISPSGRGSGEQFVMRQYPQQVAAYRVSNARKKTWLVVAIDADSGTVAGHLAQLNAALNECGNVRVRDIRIENECVARLIPRRNVETWLLVLNGNDVNEEEDYKDRHSKDEWEDLAVSGSTRLYAWTRRNAQFPGRFIDSLHHGIGELTRIERMAE